MRDTPAATRAENAVQRLRQSPWFARVGYTGAFAAFVGAVLLVIDSIGQTEVRFDWRFLVLPFLTTAPLLVLLHGLEYRAIGKASGVSVPLPEAIRLALFAAAANLIPAPGAVAVRTGALATKGVGLRSAVTVNLGAGLVWVGLGMGAAGVFSVAPAGFAVLTVALGTAVGATGILLVGRRGVRPALAILGVEASMIAAHTCQLWLVGRAVGLEEGLATAVVLALAAILSTAVGLLPAGLGLRESLSALFVAPLGVAAALGVVVALADRLVRLANLGLTTLIAARGHTARSSSSARTSDETS